MKLFALGMIFSRPEIFMGSWAVHNFMHGFFTQNFGRNFILMHENEIFMHC